MLETAPPPAPSPAIDPDRSDYLRGQLTALASLILDRAIAGLLEAPSTGSASERLLLMALRPHLPRLRPLVLSKLSEADPAGIETLMGATATAIESVLFQAPGSPLPRQRFDFDVDGRLVLVPLDA